jgi:hypothetical protein
MGFHGIVFRPVLTGKSGAPHGLGEPRKRPTFGFNRLKIIIKNQQFDLWPSEMAQGKSFEINTWPSETTFLEIRSVDLALLAALLPSRTRHLTSYFS